MATVGHQRPPQQQATPATTQLEFNQAMKDFKTMFPEMDEDVIEVVLRANQGAVDATIDQLLAMSTDNENERIRGEMDAADNAEAPPGYSPTTPPPTYQQAVPYSQQCSPGSAILNASYSLAACRDLKASLGSNSSFSDSAGSRESTPPPPPPLPSKSAQRPLRDSTLKSQSSFPTLSKSDVPLRERRQWNPRLLGPLPINFLRIALPKSHGKKSAKANKTQPGSKMNAVLCSEVLQQKMEENEKQRRLSTTEDPELVQYLEDERIALFLQNEEFMKELRSNKEFLTTLEKDAKSDDEWAPTLSDVEDSDSDMEKPPEVHMSAFPYTKPFPTEDSDAAFREKLKNMGKLSRRKFAQLARLFSRQKRRSAKQILSEGSTLSKDNLLLDESNCRSDSEEESGRPLNEYHPIKSSSSHHHHGISGSPSKYE